jgi:hypothetical protein
VKAEADDAEAVRFFRLHLVKTITCHKCFHAFVRICNKWFYARLLAAVSLSRACAGTPARTTTRSESTCPLWIPCSMSKASRHACAW